MVVPYCFHSSLKTWGGPVNRDSRKSGHMLNASFVIITGSPVNGNWITPSGTPASLKMSTITLAEKA